MEIPRHWRLKKQRYALIGEVCPHCDGKIFPPRDVCPECGKGAEIVNSVMVSNEETVIAQALLAKNA